MPVDIMQFPLSQYLERIGLSKAPAPDEEGLHEVHAGQVFVDRGPDDRRQRGDGGGQRADGGENPGDGEFEHGKKFLVSSFQFQVFREEQAGRGAFFRFGFGASCFVLKRLVRR